MLEQENFIVMAIFMLFLSVLAKINNREGMAIFLLSIFGVLVYALAISLDVFLNVWDERFHALVAKNMIGHPLMPTLYENPVVPMAYDRWDRAIIWLHKQPLFLWLITLSFKLFGISELALRLPSLIMASAIVPVTWRIGSLLCGKDVGYFSALLVATSFYLFELVSGRQSTDHNDVAFLFFVSSGIWAWIEYENSPSKRKWFWLVLIGAASGCAVLTKWLVGLVVFVPMGLSIFRKNNRRVKDIIHLAFAVLVTIVIVLPWQVLSFTWYPREAAEELSYNSLHFTEALEGHGEELLYHVHNFPTLFGQFAPFFSLIGLFLLVSQSGKTRRQRLLLLSVPLIVYLFYSLAETKMLSYPFVVAVPIYLSLGIVVSSLIGIINRYISGNGTRLFILTIFIFFLSVYNLRVTEILKQHTQEKGVNEYVAKQKENRDWFISIRSKLPLNTVLLNVPGRHYVDAMFYTGFPTYNFIPPENQIDDLIFQNYHPVVVVDDLSALPKWLIGKVGVRVVVRRVNNFG